MPVPGKNNRKHKIICWGLLNKRPLLLPKSLSNRLLEAGKKLGEARGSTPNQFVALGLYAVQIRHKSLHSTLQRMQFSPWGRHWWALPSWDHGNHPCTWWGCLESAKKEKTEKMQSLCDCVGMGIHSMHIGHSQLQHWGRFAGGWGVDANTGQLEAQPHFFWKSWKTAILPYQWVSTATACFLCCPRLWLKEVGIFSMEMSY